MALEEIQNGNIEMNKMLKSVDEIKISSNEISKIIKLIEDIAFQTNILSLNAAVEAAKSTTILIDRALYAVPNGIKTADVTATSLNKAVELSQAVKLIF